MKFTPLIIEAHARECQGMPGNARECQGMPGNARVLVRDYTPYTERPEFSYILQESLASDSHSCTPTHNCSTVFVHLFANQNINVHKLLPKSPDHLFGSL